MQVNVTPQDAKVVINSRTGSVVMNREVTLDSCAVAQGNLSVTVNRQANVSQPDTPFGGGQTVVTPQTHIHLRQSGGSLQSVRSSASLNNVVRALNALGATRWIRCLFCNQCKVRDVCGQNWKSSDDQRQQTTGKCGLDAQSLNELKAKASEDRRQISVRWPVRWKGCSCR